MFEFRINGLVGSVSIVVHLLVVIEWALDLQCVCAWIGVSVRCTLVCWSGLVNSPNYMKSLTISQPT